MYSQKEQKYRSVCQLVWRASVSVKTKTVLRHPLLSNTLRKKGHSHIIIRMYVNLHKNKKLGKRENVNE